eukprot:CAMPEP_0201476508 /NCGR_PEP_ID=MMETSP0151_2-20130828/1704_1 /ASSEMBLY_ACC=CAM_ASM_000257 /TAXON_ID=200890 /ORGANISM="Paramoeba atlantica, Strain 621/1 / CCAP 1560/9" /LENGTH=198 /DNA_ID=CAMNT_0047856895 /DNA_START=145 /DNA_END=738 /DNA_ORIENTATION=+
MGGSQISKEENEIIKNEEDKEVKEVKLVTVGDASVGKTSMLITFTSNKFPRDYVPTIFESYNTLVHTTDDQKINFCLWDTAGFQGYYQIRLLTYSKANVLLVCYSVANPLSFENIKTKWVGEISRHCPDTPFIIVATQTDLREREEIVKKLTESNLEIITTEQGKQMAQEVGASQYLECSSLAHEGLQELFAQALRIG